MLFGISVSIRLYILLFCVLTWISCVSYYCQLIKIQGSEWSTLKSRSMFFFAQSDHLMIWGPVWSLLHSIQKIASFIQILGGNHDYRDLKDFPQILRLKFWKPPGFVQQLKERSTERCFAGAQGLHWRRKKALWWFYWYLTRPNCCKWQ